MRRKSFLIVLAVGVLLLLAGILRGTELPRILAKATHICLECIGIG